MRIISLSTIPPRFRDIERTLDSLVAQDATDEIWLFIPKSYRRFPDYDGSIPKVPAGVRIVQTDEDLGPATKVLCAARSLQGEHAQILFCDDDRNYPPGWAARLFEEQAARPNDCIALAGKIIANPNPARTPYARPAKRRVSYRLQRLRHHVMCLLGDKSPRPQPVLVDQPGYVDVLLGFGGVVVRPHFFDERAYEIPDVLWAVDDYWLSGILAAAGVGIWLPAGLRRPGPTSAEGKAALFNATIDGAGRLAANRACIEYMQTHFGVWK